jgi:hypothetical protein
MGQRGLALCREVITGAPVDITSAAHGLSRPMALIALAFNAPVEARARFPNYRLTQLVASRIDMDPAELEELEELIGRKLCASVVEMPRHFNEQLRHAIKVHALGSLFKADGPGPHHHAVRPAGYDFDADEVIAARMERWRADYRAMATTDIGCVDRVALSGRRRQSLAPTRADDMVRRRGYRLHEAHRGPCGLGAAHCSLFWLVSDARICTMIQQ